MLSDHCPLCLYVLSVTLVYCGQTVGWIKTKLGVQVGLGPGHIVLDEIPANPPPLQNGQRPQFSAHVHCGQTAGWIMMPLSIEIGLGPGDFVLDGDLAPPKRVTALTLWPMSILAKRLDGLRCHLVRR